MERTFRPFDLHKVNCRSLNISFYLTMNEKKHSSILGTTSFNINDEEAPGICHEYSRNGVVHLLHSFVAKVQKQKYVAVLTFQVKTDNMKVEQSTDTKGVNEFLSSILEAGVKYRLEIEGEFHFSKEKYPLDKVHFKLPEASEYESVKGFPKLEICGVRYRSDGPVRSIIIDTLPEDYSYVNIQSSIEREYSFQSLKKHFDIQSRIAEEVFKVEGV